MRDFYCLFAGRIWTINHGAISGAGEGIRTLTSQAQRILSPWRLPVPPLPHNAHFYAELRFSPFSSSSPTDESIFGIFGGECRTRTCDIVHHKQVVKIAVTVFDKTKLLTRSTYWANSPY